MFEDVLYERALPTGEILHVLPLTFGRARINVGQPDTLWYRDGW